MVEGGGGREERKGKLRQLEIWEEQLEQQVNIQQEQIKGKMKEEKRNDEEERPYENDIDVLSNFSNSAVSGHLDSIDSNETKRKYFAPSMSYRAHHKNSFEISEFHSETEQVRNDEFFDDEIILEQKIDKKDVVFQSSCLRQSFTTFVQDRIFKFVRQPNEHFFYSLLEDIFEYGFQNIFKQPNPIETLLEDLFYRAQNTFLIYTFDWILCHLSFVTSLISFWVNVDFLEVDLTIDSPRKKGYHPEGLKFIENQQRKVKQNLIQIACLYAQERSQDLNTNQTVLVLLYYFLSFVKGDKTCDLVAVCNTQNKLINDINLFRRLNHKEKQYFSTSNKKIFHSQLEKYEKENKLIVNMERTYTLLKMITFHNFIEYSLEKFYQLRQYEASRKQYQNKKQIFCLWVLNIIIKTCQKKSTQSLHKSAFYVVIFMSILKKFKSQKNFQGISYLVPVLENIKIILPKVWNFATKRRAEIEQKLLHYNELLVSRVYREEDLGGKGVVWFQTIFGHCEQIRKKLSKNYTNAEDHEIIYEEVLKPIIRLRKNIQIEYEEELLKSKNGQEIGLSFNMYLLDISLKKLYRESNLKKEFERMRTKGKQVNEELDGSLFTDIIDYCFIGSTNKYQEVDL